MSSGPRRATFRTRLGGHDDAWGALIPDRDVAYPTLPAGDYIFHAQAVDRDLNYSEPATIALTVYTDVRDLRLAAMQAELDQLRREAGAKYRFDDIVGQSPAMQQVFALMAKAVDSGLTVLLSGPTGTG
ncbi:MAG: triple tyrosine motif-containing protein, partial [Candidatus Poribacteria bacterium]